MNAVEIGGVMETQDRQTAEMTSRKQLALRFIQRYWSAHNRSPSYGEIGAGIGGNRYHAREAVAGLVKEGSVLREHGRARSIVLPDRQDAVLAELAGRGWRINASLRELIPPTLSPLSIPAALDHITGVEGWGGDDADGNDGGSQGDAGDR